jgi:transposase
MRMVDMTDDDRAALDGALGATRRVREWRRRQAVRRRAAGRETAEVAHVLGCSASAVYSGAADWREAGVAGLAAGPHDGRPRRLAARAEAALGRRLADDPQTHG